MRWCNKIPLSLKNAAPSLKGPRSSGKTEALIQAVKNRDGTCLIVIAWPWERARWESAMETRAHTAIHTPESLARTILSAWEKKNGKLLAWEIQEQTKGNDAEEQVRNMLKEGKMSVGIAHWLLKENFCADFLNEEIDILALDDEDRWEPEAHEWITALQRKTTLRTGRCPGTTWLPDRAPRAERYAEIDWSESGAGQWAMEQLERAGSKRGKPLLVIQTEKEKWNAYIQARGASATILHAAECEGRTWKTALIPSLRKQWGGPNLAREWLDLVASRSENPCRIRIGPEGPPNWLPPTIGEKPKYLIWEAH